MANKVITKNQQNKLVNILKQYRAISLAYVFGSTINGLRGEESDLDLAIFKDKNSPLSEFSLIKETEITSIFPNLHLSVVTLESSPLFLKQVISGVCVYEKVLYLKTTTEATVMNIYFDTQHFRDVQNYYLQKRIQEGTYGYR